MQEGDALEKEGTAFTAFALRGLFPLLEKEQALKGGSLWEGTEEEVSSGRVAAEKHKAALFIRISVQNKDSVRSQMFCFASLPLTKQTMNYGIR